MSTILTLYNSFLKYQQDGTINLKDDTIKLALVTNLYSFSVEHDVLADVLGSPSCEVEQIDSPDNGYTTGGETLTGKTFTLTDSPVLQVFDAADVEWAELTATFRFGILYANVTRNGIVDPLIGCILYDDTPGDMEIVGIKFKTIWNAGGICKIEKSD